MPALILLCVDFRVLGVSVLVVPILVFLTVDPTPPPQVWQDGWYLMNRVLDCIFCADMVLQVHLCWPTPILTHSTASLLG